MPTWCAFVGRLSPLLPPVSRNSWPTSSAGERRWPPSTKFSCGPTRARHKPPPAPPRQMCQLHPPHLSPSENTLPNTSWRDFKGGTSSGKTLGREVGWSLQVWVVELGRKKKKKKKTQETSSGCNLQRRHFLFFSGSDGESERMRSHPRELLQGYESLTAFYIWWTLFIQGRMLSSS